jgi:hypothetical protein
MPYVALMRQLVEGELDATTFTTAYMDRFKDDDTAWDDEVFDLLDAVFAASDCYYSDPEALASLRAEDPGSPFYIDEQQLTDKVKRALKRLESVR